MIPAVKIKHTKATSTATNIMNVQACRTVEKWKTNQTTDADETWKIFCIHHLYGVLQTFQE